MTEVTENPDSAADKAPGLKEFVEAHRGLLTTGSLLAGLFGLTSGLGVTDIFKSAVQFVLMALVTITFSEVLLRLYEARRRSKQAPTLLRLFGWLLLVLLILLVVYWFLRWVVIFKWILTIPTFLVIGTMLQSFYVLAELVLNNWLQRGPGNRFDYRFAYRFIARRRRLYSRKAAIVTLVVAVLLTALVAQPLVELASPLLQQASSYVIP